MYDDEEPPTVYGRVFIPGPLPGINDFLRARSVGMGGRGRKRGNDYQRLKAHWEGLIRLLCMQAGIRTLPPCCFTFCYFEANKQRNPDNIASFAKFFFDALVGKPAPIIKNDGWGEIQDFKAWWRVEPKHLGVTVWAADRILASSEAYDYDALERGRPLAVSHYAGGPSTRRRIAAK